jgi:hypothetical protein
MFYPLIKLDNFQGCTTIHNYPPNNWESIKFSDKYIYIIWLDNNIWRTNLYDVLKINNSIDISTKDLPAEYFINNIAFLYPSSILLNDKLSELPTENNFNTITPSWRATIGIESDRTKVSYQGEIEPFPEKASLLTFHPFLQYNNFENFLLIINLINQPKVIESKIEIFNGYKGEFIDSQIIKTNSATLLPLNKYNFKKSDLPFFINRTSSAIPFGFGYNTDKSILSLEHTHPPASLVLHGNRILIQSQIKSKWFNKLTNA